MNTTPGFRSSELYISLLAMAYNFALGAGWIPHPNEVQTAISAIAALLLAFGYTWARTFLKTNAAAQTCQDATTITDEGKGG